MTIRLDYVIQVTLLVLLVSDIAIGIYYHRQEKEAIPVEESSNLAEPWYVDCFGVNEAIIYFFVQKDHIINITGAHVGSGGKIVSRGTVNPAPFRAIPGHDLGTTYDSEEEAWQAVVDYASEQVRLSKQPKE